MLMALLQKWNADVEIHGYVAYLRWHGQFASSSLLPFLSLER
jgi:hypothetical protein